MMLTNLTGGGKQMGTLEDPIGSSTLTAELKYTINWFTSQQLTYF